MIKIIRPAVHKMMEIKSPIMQQVHSRQVRQVNLRHLLRKLAFGSFSLGLGSILIEYGFIEACSAMITSQDYTVAEIFTTSMTIDSKIKQIVIITETG